MARKISAIALELADREAIRDTLMSYPRALDRIDMDIAAKDYHHRRSSDFVVGNKASGFDRLVFNVDHVCGRAEHDGPGKLDAILF